MLRSSRPDCVRSFAPSPVGGLVVVLVSSVCVHTAQVRDGRGDIPDGQHRDHERLEYSRFDDPRPWLRGSPTQLTGPDRGAYTIDVGKEAWVSSLRLGCPLCLGYEQSTMTLFVVSDHDGAATDVQTFRNMFRRWKFSLEECCRWRTTLS